MAVYILAEGSPFPPADRWDRSGLVALGGELSPGRLLDAYRQGLFPWFEDDSGPIMWWSPDPRMVIFLEDFHVPRRLKQLLKQDRFRITVDRAFTDVINGCKRSNRADSHTWITDRMISAYSELHLMGYAHSIEVWSGDFLAGGLYGLSIGKCFFGESMFQLATNASKVALVALRQLLSEWGYPLVDCQTSNPHLSQFGAMEISRIAFRQVLAETVTVKPLLGDWTAWKAERLVLDGK